LIWIFHGRPLAFAASAHLGRCVHRRLWASAGFRWLGCQLGCQLRRDLDRVRDEFSAGGQSKSTSRLPDRRTMPTLVRRSWSQDCPRLPTSTPVGRCPRPWLSAWLDDLAPRSPVLAARRHAPRPSLAGSAYGDGLAPAAEPRWWLRMSARRQRFGYFGCRGETPNALPARPSRAPGGKRWRVR